MLSAPVMLAVKVKARREVESGIGQLRKASRAR